MSENKIKPVSFKIILITLLIGLLLTGAYCGIKSNLAKEELKGLIIAQLEEIMDRGIYIGKIKSYSLNSLTLSDLKIYMNRDLKEEDLIFTAQELVATYNIDLISTLKKQTTLSIEDITFRQAEMTLIRDKEGVFDFAEKFNLHLDKFPDFYRVKKISFEDSKINYLDYHTTKEDGLLTIAHSVEGKFYVENLPQIEFSCSGLRREDQSPITIAGSFFVDRQNYSLDFLLKEAEITHFQPYLKETDSLKVKGGRFNSNLHLTCQDDAVNSGFIRSGEVSFREAELAPEFLNGLELQQAEGNLTLSNQKITLQKFTAFYHNSPFMLSGEIIYGEDLAYHLNLTSEEFTLPDIEKGLQEYFSFTSELNVQGTSSLSMEIIGSGDIFQFQGTIASPKIKIAGYDLSRMNAEFTYAQNTFRLQDMKAEVEGGVMEGKGEITFIDNLPQYNLSFHLQKIDTGGNLLSALPLKVVKEGLCSADVDIKGSITQKERIALYMEGEIANKSGTLSLLVDGFISEGNNLNLQVQSSGINLQECTGKFSGPELSGKANFIGKISGSPENLKITGDLEIREGQIAEFPLDKIETRVNYQANRLELEDIFLQNEGLIGKGRGNITFSEAQGIRTDFVFQIEELKLNYLGQFMEDNQLPLNGKARGKIALQGGASEITAQGNLKLSDLLLANFEIDSADLDFSFEEGKIKLERAKIDSPGVQYYAQGEINWPEEPSLNLRVNFLKQDISALLSSFLSADILKQIKGQATGSLEIRGVPESPDLSLSAIIEYAQMGEVPLNSVEIKAEKHGAQLQINRLTLKQKRGKFSARGWIDLAEDNHLEISLSADQVDLKQLGYIFSFEEEIEGLVSFQAEINGDLNSPYISLQGEVKEGKIADFSFEKCEIEASYSQDVLEIKEFNLEKEGHLIQGRGKIPYKFSLSNQEEAISSITDLPLDFNLVLQNADLSLLKLFFPREIKQIQGRGNIYLQLSGSLNQPVLNGEISLQDGEAELYSLPNKINKLNASLHVKDNLIKIEKMSFLVDNYPINASGALPLEKWFPQDINIDIWTAEEEFIWPDLFQAKIKLQAKIGGSLKTPKLSGKLTIAQGEVSWRGSKQDLPFQPAEFLSRLASLPGDIDLEVEILDDLLVRVKNSDLKLGGDMKLQGNLSSPRLNGELKIKQGYISFLDKSFRISRGRILLVDSRGEDMILDIDAKTNIDDIEILLKVSGILTQPVMTLSSSPPLSEGEIISLLMFNKNYTGLTQGELEIVLREEIINLIAQGLSIRFLSQIENRVAESLGLDEFKIETIFTNESGSEFSLFPDFGLESLAFKLGKYFTNNFYLSYSMPILEMGLGDLELEYKLDENLTFSTKFDSLGLQNNEFEVKFELKYEF